MTSTPPVHATHLNDFEALKRDYMSLTQSYQKLERQNESLRTDNAAAATANSRAPIMPLTPAVTGKCLCPKCTTGEGGCKKFDAWSSYTAWFNHF